MLFISPKWRLLATVAPNTVTVATLGPTPIFDPMKFLHVEGFISGYAGNGLGRMRPGNTTVDTGNNCSSNLQQLGTASVVTSVSVPGWPVASTANLAARHWTADIYNLSGSQKRMVGHSSNVSSTATTAPTQAIIGGIWVNTAGPIQIMDLVSYSAPNGTTTNVGIGFTAGTEFEVWGKDS